MDKELLSRLYNLLSDESIRLTDYKKTKNNALEAKDIAIKEMEELTENIAVAEKLLEDLNLQGWDLNEYLSGVVRQRFATVLDILKLSFEPEEIRGKLEDGLPREIEKCEKDIENYKERLSMAQKDEKEAERIIVEVDKESEIEYKNQELLKEKIELALKGDLDEPRSKLEEFFALFDFNVSERIYLSKALSYPEDSLIPFDESTKVREGKNIVDILADAKRNAPEEETFIEPILEEPVHTVASLIEPKEITEEEVRFNLDDFGLSIAEFELFHADGIDEIMTYLTENFDEKTITDNLAYTRGKNISDKIYYKEPKLLLDKDLISKIDLFLEVFLKRPKDIELSPLSLVNNTLEELKEVVKTCPTFGISVIELPLYLFAHKDKLKNYLDNFKFLRDLNNGYNLDFLIATNACLLCVNTLEQTKKIDEVLTAYGIDKKRVPLKVFAESPAKVADLFDTLIETNIQSELINNPELLNKSVASILSKIFKDFKDIQPEIDTNNKMVRSYSRSNEAVDYLDSAYNDNRVTYTLNNNAELGFNEENPDAYNIEGILVSKRKLQRNMSLLLEVKDKFNLTDNQIKFISALYNSCKKEEDIVKLVECFDLLIPDVEQVAFGGLK